MSDIFSGRKMRIAFFHELPPGGARRAVNEYARNLKKNHIIDLYITEHKSTNEKTFYTNIFNFPFSPKNWQGNNWKVRLYKDSMELYQLYKLHRKIANHIDNGKYNVAFVSASRYIQTPFITRFLKVPFIYFSHDPFYRIIYDSFLAIPKDIDVFRYLYEKLNRFVRKILERENVNYASIFVVPSKFISDLFDKTYNKRAGIVYYGVDSSFFKPGNINKDIDIFYIGSHHFIDGYEFLKDVLNRMKLKPKTRLLLTDIEWISDDKKLRELYRRSRIVVCTAYREGLGMVALEAMSCGIPVVAVDEAGHKETVIDGFTGYLLERDPQKMAKKLDYLLKHPEQISKLGKQARETILRKWSWPKRTEELENILLKHAIF